MTTRQSPGRPARLSERDVSYLKLLKTLKAAGGEAGTDLGVVRRIATWYDSTPVLAFIAAQPRWYGDWEVREGLLRNDRTPQRVRRELETSIAVFELLHDMDAPGVTAVERAEIQEDVRHLFQALAEPDRRVVKRRAYELSASRRAAASPGSAPDGASTIVARRPVARADDALTQVLGELVPTGEIASEPAEPAAAPSRAPLGPGGGRDAAPARFDLLAQEVAGITAAGDAGLHQTLRDVGAGTWAPPSPAEIDDAELELLEATLLDDDDAPAPAPPPEAVRVPERPAAPPSPAPAPPSATARPTVPPPGPPPSGLPAPGPKPAAAPRTGVSALPPAEKVALAAGSADADVLGLLVHEGGVDLGLALVGNPALSEAHAVILARRASSRVAEAIYRNRRLFSRPAVQRALLECPQAPAAALLEVVNGIGQIPELIALIRNPKVRFLEVKAKARGRLGAIFKSLGPGDKVAMIRRAGRGIVRELWTDFFRDEALVLRCLKEQQLDEAIVLEIARSKVAPRRALEVIGTTAAWAANPSIRLELVLNPRTPRPVATRLVQKLSPADRKLVRGNPALPESVRRYA